MPNNNTNIEKLPDVIVEDITELVEWYIEHLSFDPVSNQQYTPEQITAVMCRHAIVEWEKDDFLCLHMECCLLRETISDLRLDAIQQTNSIKEIATICRDTGV